MYATLASIQLAHLVLRGTPMPQDAAYKDIGDQIYLELGKEESRKLFTECQAVIEANPYPATYEDMAAAVLAQRA